MAIFIIRDDILLLSLIDLNFLYMKKGKFKLNILLKNTLLFILIYTPFLSVSSQEIIPGSEMIDLYIEKLEKEGINVYPSSINIKTIQNKSIQKNFYLSNK